MGLRQLLSRKFALFVTPGMNYEELLDLATTSERYRVKIAKGIVKVRTMTIEDEKKGNELVEENEKRSEK